MNKLRVRLYGALRAKFGKEFHLVAATPGVAIHALCKLLPGFEKYLLDNSEPGFHVICGDEDGLEAEDLGKPARGTVVKLVPVISGASDGIRILAGAILVVAGLAISGWSFGTLTPLGSMLVGMGTSMILGGVADMLTKPPMFNPAGLNNGPADTPTYAFQGPHMTTGQGNCVPVGYGRIRVGGALISAGIDSETWPTNGFGGAAPDEVGTMGGDGSASPWVWAVAPIQG